MKLGKEEREEGAEGHTGFWYMCDRAERVASLTVPERTRKGH